MPDATARREATGARMDQIEIHWLWWLVAAVALGVIEVLTLDLVLLMFAVGAVAALVSSILGADVTGQVLTFGVTSLVMLVGLRPYLLRNLRSRTPLVETNAAGLVGRVALTLGEVTERGGLVKLAGEQWTARSAHPGEVFPPDVDVRVVQIDGATAVVGPLQPGGAEHTTDPHPYEAQRLHDDEPPHGQRVHDDHPRHDDQEDRP